MTIEAISELSATEIRPMTEFLPNQMNIAPTQQFAEIFTDGIDSLNKSLQKADQMLTDMALSKPVSTHEVMIAMQEAKSELRLAVEVRNKLLEGYQEIMRMQV